jgi:Protein of unknown function (DUF2911)
MTRALLFTSAMIAATAASGAAQTITLPPNVHAPNGDDRRGKIWGTLVPYGIHDLGFNNRKGPWRAGANENTVFTVTHPVKINGQPLAAGRYGVHMLAGEKEWTIIFSKNSTSWGSFTYDPAEDALRVTARPEKAPYREWLTYDVIDRKPDRATVALQWEELSVPFTITVDDMPTLYIDNMRRELRSFVGFNAQQWLSAAQYCLQVGRNLDEALTWADNAISLPGVGQATFPALSTKAQILEKLSRTSEAAGVMAKAMDLPNALPVEIHQYGRRLLTQGKVPEAMAAFQKNAKRFGEAWPTHVGLARGYSATGDYKSALAHAEKALTQAPDDLNRKSLQDAIVKLKQGQDMNK